MPSRSMADKPIHPGTPVRTSVNLDPVSELAYQYLTAGDGKGKPDLGDMFRLGLVLGAIACGASDKLLHLYAAQNEWAYRVRCADLEFPSDGTKVDFQPIFSAMRRRPGELKARSFSEWAKLAGMRFNHETLLAWYLWFYTENNQAVVCGKPHEWPTAFWWHED